MADWVFQSTARKILGPPRVHRHAVFVIARAPTFGVCVEARLLVAEPRVETFISPHSERDHSSLVSGCLIRRNTGMREPLQLSSVFPQHRHSNVSMSRNVSFSSVALVDSVASAARNDLFHVTPTERAKELLEITAQLFFCLIEHVGREYGATCRRVATAPMALFAFPPIQISRSWHNSAPALFSRPCRIWPLIRIGRDLIFRQSDCRLECIARRCAALVAASVWFPASALASEGMAWFPVSHTIWEICARMIVEVSFSRASGSNLTFESHKGFPLDSTRASLAHANRNFHHSQAR